MHRFLTRFLARRRRAAGERGVAALMVAITAVALLLVGAMVLDFGLVRIDRQADRSAADAATLAGLASLDGGDRKPHPYQGVCASLRYLRANDARFAAISSAAGAWTDGTGATVGNGCSDTALQAQVCTPGNQASWGRFTWTGTWQGMPLKVVIQSGYQLPAPGPASPGGWPEDTLPAAQADTDDGAQGCDQLVTLVTQNRRPSLGSLASTADLSTSIRSVGRVRLGPGGDAPAMLLLKRTGCPVLETGGSGGGSFIHVSGAISTNGKSQPGTIHSDADGSGCSGGSGANIFWGRAAAGIVAYAAPLVGNPSLPDPTKPGRITSVAVAGGISGTSSIVRDSSTNVYGSAALDPATAGSAAKSDPGGRTLVTRKPVDDRYLAGVHAAIDGAQANVFDPVSGVNAGNAASKGYTVVTGCTPSTTITAPKVFVDCTDNNGYKGTAVINSPTVVFNGRVNPAFVQIPNAKQVYIFGIPGKPGLEFSGGGPAPEFSMNTAGNLDGSGKCSEANSTSKAVLFIKDGEIKQNTGLLRLCYTTVFMMGGQKDGCLPATGYATAPGPYAKPCALAATPTEGTGQLSQTGGTVDWTAPNQWDVMSLANGDPDPARAPSWSDPNGPEDLAFWSESGVSASATYNINGGGTLHAVGVYMVPNADPFTISGGANQVLKNAQYIASSIYLNGNNTSITMSVDANSAVTLPKLRVVGLVR